MIIFADIKFLFIYFNQKTNKASLVDDDLIEYI